jgi:hypothetical protein
MNDLVKLKLRLLILQHGRREVVQALAAMGEQTVEGVEAELNKLEQKKASRTRRVVSAVDALTHTPHGSPETEELLRKLAIRFDNRSFLPQLTDVQRFLERSNSTKGKIKSRRDASHQVVLALSRMTADELSQLLRLSGAGKNSDYADLARQIMGRQG